MTVHEVRINPSTLKGRILYDNRRRADAFGTVLALTHDPRDYAKPIELGRLLMQEGRHSIQQDGKYVQVRRKAGVGRFRNSLNGSVGIE